MRVQSTAKVAKISLRLAKSRFLLCLPESLCSVCSSLHIVDGLFLLTGRINRESWGLFVYRRLCIENSPLLDELTTFSLEYGELSNFISPDIVLETVEWLYSMQHILWSILCFKKVTPLSKLLFFKFFNRFRICDCAQKDVLAIVLGIFIGIYSNKVFCLR